MVEQKKQRLVDQAVATWNAAKVLHNDNFSSLGDKYYSVHEVLTPQSMDFLEEFEIPHLTVDRIIKSNLSLDSEGMIAVNESEGSVRQYMRIFQSYGSDLHLEQAVREALEKNPGKTNFFSFLMDVSPVVGTGTVLLYDLANNLSENIDEEKAGLPKEMRPFAFWYKETIDSAERTYQGIDEFFENLLVRREGRFESTTTTDFLNSWRHDLQLNIVELVNLANSMGIHVRVENCAVFMSFVEVPVRYGEFESVRREILSLWKYQSTEDRGPLFEQYSQALRQYNEHADPHNGNLYVPAYVGVGDLSRLVKSYQRFWDQVGAGMNAEKRRVDPTFESAYRIKLGDSATVLLRPKPTDLSEARIAVLGKGNYEGFNIRVDSERTRHKLSLDIGSVKRAQLIAYARAMAIEDSLSGSVMNYEDNVDESGKIKRGSRLSYLAFDSGDALLTAANKFAILTAIAMEAGHATGIRSEDPFSYHAGHGALSNPEFYREFPKIVESVKNMLLRKMPEY